MVPVSQHSVSPAKRLPARADRIAAVVIGLVAVILGFLAGRFNPLLAHSTAAEGARVDTLFSVLLGIGTTIFCIVNGTLLYAIFRFRSAPGDEEGSSVRGHTGLEILWTAVPAVIVTGLAIFSYTVLAANEIPAPDALTVEVTARQFAWEFRYLDGDVRSTELHVPRGRQVYLKMHSADVIHAFWVPDFRIKKDLMPDRVTEVRFTPEQDGTYPIVCSRVCGLGHAFMRSGVVVQEPADFEAWLGQQSGGEAQGGQPGAGSDAAMGKQVFQKYGCNACHTLSDAQAKGQVGPNLDGIGSKAGSLVAGESAEQYLSESITKPNAFVVPGYPANIMPQDLGQRISDQELEALVQYLLAQK